MSFHYHSTRTRSVSPIPYTYSSSYPYTSPAHDNSYSLTRRTTRHDLYDDDLYDDYPHHSSSHKSKKPSRALTLRRQPTSLEKYNVWPDTYRPSSSSSTTRYRYYDNDSANDDLTYSRRKYSTTTVRPSYSPSPRRSADDDDEYRINVKATFSRPKSSSGHRSEPKLSSWDRILSVGDAGVYKRREKCVDEGWEERERGREQEWEAKYRKVKRTRTDEWKPLSGWRRAS